jgi:hypothetical protein
MPRPTLDTGLGEATEDIKAKENYVQFFVCFNSGGLYFSRSTVFAFQMVKNAILYANLHDESCIQDVLEGLYAMLEARTSNYMQVLQVRS